MAVMIRHFVVVTSILIPLTLSAGQASVADSLRKLPLAFEENHGQAPSGADFLAHGAGYGVTLTGGDAHLSLRSGANASTHIGLTLAGSQHDRKGKGQQALQETVNYFIGKDPGKWRTGIATFGRVEYDSVYPGVDVAYYGHQGRLEYDFIVAPGGDPSGIRMALDGARGLRVDGGGNLVLETGAAPVSFRKPVSYQEIGGKRRAVESRYLLAGGNRVGFQLGNYNHRYALVIDPTLVYSTYLGGSGFDYGTAIAVDSSGSAYVTGYTSSLDFPTKTPAQAYFPGSSAIFVAKLASNGQSLDYATYLGGSIYDYPYGIAVDSTGAAYVAGLTESYDFPVVNAMYSSLNGGQDAFVTKFSPSGQAMVYSTYLGGSGSDNALGIAVDASQNVYVAGETQSSDFPVTSGAYQTSYGSSCSFVSKINAAGTALTWATYFGSSCSAQTTAIAVDAQDAVYVTGAAFPGLPVTASAPQSTFGGGEHDAFMAKLDSTGSSLVYCTYLGGSQSDAGTAIAVNSSGDAYATGLTQSLDLPATGSALQGSSGGGYDAFVAEVNAAGTAWEYVTYLGGQRDDYGYGIALDSSGNAYVAGYTISNDLSTTSAVQGSLAGNQYVLYRTTGSGKTWNSSDSGLPATPAVIAVDPASDSHWMAATAEGLYQSTDSGKQWSAIGSFANDNMYGVAFSPAGGTVYASSFTSIYVSGDSGSTWTFQGVAPCAASSLAVDPNTATTVYLASSCAAQSLDGGATWSVLGGALNGQFFHSIVVGPASQPTVYATTYSGLFSSTDGAQSFSQVNIAGLQYPNVTAVAINPTTPADVYAVANGSVYASTNSGATWTLASTGITSNVNSLAIAPSKPAVLYAGTSAGVFSTSNSAGTWKAAGETGASISLVAVDAVNSSTAFAATSVNSDGFVAKVNSKGSKLSYLTYLGGSGNDYALGIGLSSSGNAFVTGAAQSPDFPSTKSAFQAATGATRSTAFVASIESKTTSCSENASPTSAFFYASGGSANFSITAPSGCSWTPKASATWITLGTYGGPGTGTLAFSAAANTGKARTGSVTVGGTTVSVSQAKSGCTYSLSTSGLTFQQGGGSLNVGVTAGSGCGWVVTGLPEWLTVTSGASGTGNGTVVLKATPNPFPYSRGGFPTIANIPLGSSENGTSQ